MKHFDVAVTLWTCVRTVLGSNLPSCELQYRAADKSLARPGRKQATATEDFDFRISYLQS
jgi:hypothetical protein